MSAPLSNLVALGASTTSSGFTDGLGRRGLAFDREDGSMLERLTLRPELAAFESMLRERIDQIAAVEDERIARPRWIETDPDGAVVVVSEFVPGSRLSDLLDIAAEQGAAPGLDAAFGYLLDALPALCGLHAAVGFAHGTVAPTRTVLTPAGQVVLLDGIYGGPLSLLRYSSRRLWCEFKVAVPPSPGPAKLGLEVDIGQVVLSSLMLVLGRPLYEDEFPDALPRVVADVLEVAQIRGSFQFSRNYQQFLERTLPLQNRRHYATADDALIDLRGLAAELGLDACRRALVEFIEQTEPSGTSQARPQAGLHDLLEGMSTLTLVEQDDPDEEDSFLEASLDDDLIEAEIDLEDLADEPAYAFSSPADVELEIDDSAVQQGPPAGGALEGHGAGVLPALPTPEPSLLDSSIEAASPGTQPDPSHGTETAAAAAEPASSVRSRRAKRTRSARARKDKLRSAAVPIPLATQKTPAPVQQAAAKEPAATDNRAPEAPTTQTAQADQDLPADKPGLSLDVNQDKPTSSTWLVPPNRAAAFQPPLPDSPANAPFVPRPIGPAPPQPVMPPAGVPFAVPVPFAPPPSFGPLAPTVSPPAPIPLAPQVVPAVAHPQGPGVATGWTPTPMSPAPIQPVPTAVTAAPVARLKLKDPAPRPRPIRPLSEDIYAPPPASRSQTASAFPWKLAAGALAALVILIAAGRTFLLTDTTSPADDDVVESTATPTDTPPARGSTPVRPAPGGGKPTAPATATGRLEIETQPAGAHVQLDGQPVGVSPVTLESVPAGRHSVTLTSGSGTVRRVVRVEAGRTLKIDVPIFSGWVGIFVPFVMEVSEGGRVIGTTEEPRIMLSPGRHTLTLTNRELGYRAVETVEIEPGEVRSLTLDPRGTVNLNASPWAEVWIGGKKAGDTPLAGLQLPLGTQELLFRHPQYGERKVIVTVKGNQPAALSVNMMK